VCTAARVLCPISLRTPPGLCSRPTNSPRPAHGGSWGRLLCVHARGVCFWLLAFLCSPARLSLCLFVPYAPGAAILIPCPALGTPQYPYRNATYARVRACLRPYVLTPATGVHFFGSAAMPSDAPPAHPRAEKRPQVSAQPPAPGTRLRPLPPSSSLSALPEGSPGRPEELTWSRLRARLSARRPAGRSVLPEPSPRARCAAGAPRSPRLYRPSGPGAPRSPLRAAARSAGRPRSPLVVRPERRGEQEEPEEQEQEEQEEEEEEERERSREKEESGGRG